VMTIESWINKVSIVVCGCSCIVNMDNWSKNNVVYYQLKQ